MDLLSLSPYIRVAWDSTIIPPFYLERVIYDYELLYVKTGEVEIIIEGTKYRGIPGDLFLIKPNQAHSVRVLGVTPFHQPHLHFDLFYLADSPEVKTGLKQRDQLNEQEKGWFREDICSTPPFDIPNHIRLSHPETFEKMLFDVIFEFARKIPYSEFAQKGLFINLWTQLLRELYLQRNSHVANKWDQLTQIKSLLDHHHHEPISLEELAKIVNLNKYYLIKIFKNAFGLSPIQYHLQKRIEKAKEAIQFTSTSISEIANAHGFESIHSFSRAFRKVEGVAPSFYRHGH